MVEREPWTLMTPKESDEALEISCSESSASYTWVVEMNTMAGSRPNPTYNTGAKDGDMHSTALCKCLPRTGDTLPNEQWVPLDGANPLPEISNSSQCDTSTSEEIYFQFSAWQSFFLCSQR